MSGLLINQTRRVSAASAGEGGAETGVNVAGRLLSTGAFVFVDGGVTKILAPSHLANGLYGLAGDPKIRPDGWLVRSYAYTDEDLSDSYLRFFDGRFTNRIARPAENLYDLDGADYPDLYFRYYRHRSDNDQAIAYVIDGRWSLAGDKGHALTIDLSSYDSEPMSVDIQLVSLNRFGIQPDQASDTYFGNVIGLGSGVLITSHLIDGDQNVKAMWWDGSNLTAIPVDDDLVGIHPLCRDGPDTALCTYSKTLPSGVFTTDLTGRELQYLGTGDGDWQMYNPPVQEVQNLTGGSFMWGCQFSGSESGVMSLGPAGATNFRRTLMNDGIVNGEQVYLSNGSPLASAFDYVSPTIVLSRTLDGVYIFTNGAPENAGNPEYWMPYIMPNGGVRYHSGVRYQAQSRDGEFPTYFTEAGIKRIRDKAGITPLSGCMTDAGPFVVGRLIQTQAERDATDVHMLCGLVSGRKYPAPNDLDSARPIGAGGFVFMDGMHSQNFGSSWEVTPVAIGGQGSGSSCAMSVPYTFKLTASERAAAVAL